VQRPVAHAELEERFRHRRALRIEIGHLLELDHPDGGAARERIEEMVLFSERREQPEGPTPRLFTGSP